MDDLDLPAQDDSVHLPTDYLYFVQTKVTGHIKIGRAADVARRLKNIASGNHEPVTLIARLPGMGWQEPVWHIVFSAQRANGEWFKSSQELLAAINCAVLGHKWTEMLGDDGGEVAASLLDLCEELTIAPPEGRQTIRGRLIALADAFAEVIASDGADDDDD